jgi:hypothetical protein
MIVRRRAAAKDGTTMDTGMEMAEYTATIQPAACGVTPCA